MTRRLEERGASIHFLRNRARCPDARAIHFVFRIDNYPHITRAYGPEVARSALGELSRLLVEFFGDEGLVIPEPDGRLELLLWNCDRFDGRLLEGACDAWIHSLCAAIAMVPIECVGERLHLAVSGAWGRVDEVACEAPDIPASRALRALECIRFPGEAPGQGDIWSARYRRDMAAAAELFGAIDARELVKVFAAIGADKIFESFPRSSRHVALVWQPVRGIGDASGILYHECLIRLIDGDGAIQLPGERLTALERLGVVRALDHYILSVVITELENSPDIVLGVNISAQSAQFEGWWRDIERRLAADSAIARRLVIEITETAAMPSISASAAFASRMRSLGCMIALDDFGTGFASIRQLLALSPDIAKVDRLFVARVGQSARDRAAFTHLVGLAGALVPVVIVEGIENEEQSRLALEAGAVWQQGHFHGRPVLARSWRWATESSGGASWSGPGEEISQVGAEIAP